MGRPWPAPYVVLAELAQDPSQVATVDVQAIPALMALCAGIQTVLAARLAGLASNPSAGVAFDFSGFPSLESVESTGRTP